MDIECELSVWGTLYPACLIPARIPVDCPAHRFAERCATRRAHTRLVKVFLASGTGGATLNPTRLQCRRAAVGPTTNV